jgi:hypothetical protein
MQVKTRSGLPNAGENAFIEVRTKSLAQTHGSGGLALAKWGGGDCGHQNVFAIWLILEALQNTEAYLSLVIAVKFELLRLKPKFFSKLPYRFELSFLGDFDVGRYRFTNLQWSGRNCVSLGLTHELPLRIAWYVLVLICFPEVISRDYHLAGCSFPSIIEVNRPPHGYKNPGSVDFLKPRIAWGSGWRKIACQIWQAILRPSYLRRGRIVSGYFSLRWNQG